MGEHTAKIIWGYSPQSTRSFRKVPLASQLGTTEDSSLQPLPKRFLSAKPARGSYVAGNRLAVPRDVQISLRPTIAPSPTLPPSQHTVEPVKNDLDQEAFEMALARVFFVCALPFILLEAQVIRDFMAMVAPTLKLPSRQKLSTVLLQNVQDDVRMKVVDLINNHTYVSLVTDGWTDTNSSSIINFMVVSPGMPSMVWSSWFTRSKQHTARYFADKIEKVIGEIERETTAQVVGVVTDNASNMRSATEQVQIRRPNVVSGGCAAHVLNLLMQDVSRFDAVKAVVTRAVAVTRFVREHLALLDEFKRLQRGIRDSGMRARSLVLPVPTRWYSIHAYRYRGTPSNRKNYASLSSWFGMMASGAVCELLCLRYHIEYGVTSANEEEPEGEFAVLDANGEEPEAAFAVLDAIGSEEEDHDQAVDGIGMLSHAAETMSTTTSGQENMNQTATADLPDGGEYQRITAYVHSNAMAVAFLLDPAISFDDFVGDDDENIDEQVCMLATRCGLMTPANMAKLTAEIFKFKCMKRRGGEDLRMKYLEASPRDYWGAKHEKNYPLLKKVA
ncbi:hypothetical protein GN958_ATG22289 [Phytophthora infestans]|uniref:DUF659 domain-containing protein n=1 Tax=Phytophthora infestans TaxID=4787 RepID=A0A8S9TRA8_PHYIN|nr:hypothetical protein GN958_ATG22289 [Phytophthora infestans]